MTFLKNQQEKGGKKSQNEPGQTHIFNVTDTSVSAGKGQQWINSLETVSPLPTGSNLFCLHSVTDRTLNSHTVANVLAFLVLIQESSLTASSG